MRKADHCWLHSLLVALCVLAFFTGCTDPQKAKQKYFESGQRYFDKGQYAEAQLQFKNATSKDPNFGDGYFKLALTELKLGLVPDAYQDFLKTIQIEPDNYAAHLELAKLLIMVRQYPEAKDQLDKLLEKQPNSPDVYMALAEYYNLGTKNPGAAVDALHTVLKYDPNRSDAYLTLGVIGMQEQQWPEAEANLKKAVELAPKSADASLLALGSFYLRRGRFPEAEQAFEQAKQNVPGDPNARLALADLFMAENKRSEAENLLSDSKRDFPDNSVGYRLLGDFYKRTGQLDKAEAEYALLYKDHSKDPVVKGNYIILLIMINHLDQARALNDEVLKDQPSSIDAQIRKGYIEIQGGKANDAVNTLQGVLKNDPDNGLAHYQLGRAFDLQGNGTRAEAEWRNAVRLSPDIVDAHVALAQAAMHTNDASLLAQEADAIISLIPGSPEGYGLRAIAEYDRRQYGAAEQSIKTALEKDPDNVRAYIYLGKIRLAEGQHAEGQKAFQRALELAPNSVEALGGVVAGYVAQNQLENAFAAVQAQVAKYPNDSNVHLLMGSLFLDKKRDFRNAETEFQRAISLDKNNTTAYLRLAEVQTDRHDMDAALKTYLDAANANPNEVGFDLMAAKIYWDRQDWDRAKPIYQKVLGLQPENAVASNDLAYIMLQQGGNVEVAFAMAQTARRQLPDDPGTADTLGWAFYQKGVYTSAIELFKEALRKQPDNALYNYHLGLAYAKNGQTGLAQRQLGLLKPKSSEADDLKRTLSEMKGQG